MKKKKIAVFLLLSPFLCCGSGFFLAGGWGRSRVAAYDELWQKALAAQREQNRVRGRPVLRGEPIDDNAASRYRRLVPATNGLAESGVNEIAAAVRQGPGAGIPVPAARRLEARRADLSGLREAVRCTRCDWEVAIEEGPRASFPPIFSLAALGELVVLDALDVAATDSAGAVDRCLDAARFATDLAWCEVMSVSLSGETVGQDALLALARLVARDAAGALPGERIARELDVLERSLPRPRDVLRGERLVTGTLGKLCGTGELWPEGRKGAAGLVPEAAVVAAAQPELDAAFDEVERAAGSAGTDRLLELEKAAVARVGLHPNPLVSRLPVAALVERSRLDGIRARFALARAALALERARRSGGSYPGTLELPADPFAAPALLRYETDGRSYRLWSLGPNRRNDGGAEDDVLLARSP